MLCERCKRETATIHLTEIIKDVKSEVHLCEGCAKDIGLNSKLSEFSISIPEMLSFLSRSDLEGVEIGERCRACGTTFMDYTRTGRLGCPECYQNLRESIMPIIQNIHGRDSHKGKFPLNYNRDDNRQPEKEENAKKEEDLYELNINLEKAVLEEKYEEAAVFRDRIDELIKGSGA